MEPNSAKPLIEIRQAEVHFPLPGFHWRGDRPVLKAVQGVSLEIHRGETLGLVGESGCGKSTLGRALVGLTSLARGLVRWQGMDIQRFSTAERKEFKRRVQMIFQDPYGSLNPRFNVQSIVSEGLDIHGLGGERKKNVTHALRTVGLDESVMERYPHEFSGGQRQRIGIARALVMNPDLIICDEPVSALDVSIQAQIIALLKSVQNDLGIAYLFIAHDLAVVANISHRIAVMYLGKMVEVGKTKEVMENPVHPYTRLLLETAPTLHRKKNRGAHSTDRETMDPPSPLKAPGGCSFHPRCPLATEFCRRESPVLEIKKTGALAACHHRD